jgi:adenine-specific DNA-methyltransferase
MKYMGSKRWMLQNGLGDVLAASGRDAKRFVDLFAGSGAVAIHMARRFPLAVLAVDLQRYSAVLTGAIIQRNAAVLCGDIWANWHARALKISRGQRPPKLEKITRDRVLKFRDWCGKRRSFPLTRAYGGHYFSPIQATWLDSLRATIPAKEPQRTVALAALLDAATKCAASPGHTAQPFQPTRSAKLFVLAAWQKDITELTKSSFADLSNVFAQRKGSVRTADANEAAKSIREGDLVFIDPPYSGVQYSRFYHVLESIERGDPGLVSGTGRYPDRRLRPRSRYSLKRESREALSELLGKIASKGAKAIVTFPAHKCSNGLSGNIVQELARQHFRVRVITVRSKFSTLGGTSDDPEKGRKARQSATELILCLNPK